MPRVRIGYRLPIGLIRRVALVIAPSVPAIHQRDVGGQGGSEGKRGAKQGCREGYNMIHEWVTLCHKLARKAKARRAFGMTLLRCNTPIAAF